MKRLYGLIPAAGKGTRARPYTSNIPKSMLEINGIPNLQRNIELMRDQLDIVDIVIVTGYLAEVIETTFGDGQRFGVRLHYVRNRDLDKGLAWSILLGREVIDDTFCVILSDECYVNSNHYELKSSKFRESLVTCALKEVDDTELIRRNYAVQLEGDKIRKLIEKPLHVENDILGCGTFILSAEIFPLLDQAFRDSPDGYVEFVTFLGELCRSGKEIQAFFLNGSYVNINDRDSLARAKFLERSHNFARLSKALLIYSEGTEKNVSFTIERYKKTALLDRLYLIVPEENEIEQIAREHGIALIRCPRHCTLYGQKIRYALDQADADILILTEADYAFPARDIEKLLVYLKEADMVIGTRTTRQLMEQGTDLAGVVRLANVFVAKLMELLWWRFEGRFTDVGCTFRALWQSSWQAIRNETVAPGPEFSAEMMLELLKQRLRVLEIPVNYHNVSRKLNKNYRNINTFFRFLLLLAKKRIS